MRFYTSPDAAAAKLPFSQAVQVGDVLDLSGALGHKPGTRKVVDGGIEAETRQTMENIGAVLKANGLTFDDVFKCTVMLADMAKWEDFNKAAGRENGTPEEISAGADHHAQVSSTPRQWRL